MSRLDVAIDLRRIGRRYELTRREKRSLSMAASFLAGDWQPPREDRRQDGYVCLGLVPTDKNLDGEWREITWAMGRWWLNMAAVAPSRFAPLPHVDKEKNE